MRLASERSKTKIKSIEQPGRPLCIVVLGMHRSGTSVLAGALGLLGVSLPKKMMPPNASNPKGFFEPNDIVELHDKMLSDLGSSWADCRRLDPALFNSAATAQFRTRLVAALKNEYGSATKFVVKDPRICRFFPFWRDVADAFGAETRVVFVVRNPLEVARSLAQRDEFSLGYSLNLWLRHILDAEFDTRHCKRIFVSNDDFMSDWVHVIKKIERELGVELLNVTPKARTAVEGLIDLDMRHYSVDEDTFAFECRDYPSVLKAYRSLKELIEQSSDSKAIDALDEVRESFDKSTEAFDNSFGSDFIYMQAKFNSARARIAELEARASEVNLLKEDLGRAQSRVRDLEANLTTQANEVAHLNAQILAGEDRNKQNLSRVRDLETNLAAQANEMAHLNAQILAGEDRDKQNLSRVHGLEANLAEQANEMAHLNAQMLAMEDRNKQNLTELAALRNLHEVDQERISKLGSQLERVWANEFRQKSEQRQLEAQVARLTAEAANLTSELKVLNSSLSWRLIKPFRSFSRKLRGLQA